MSETLYCSDCKQLLNIKCFSKGFIRSENVGWCKLCRNKHDKKKRNLRLEKGICVRCQKEKPPNCGNYCEYHHIEAMVCRNFGRKINVKEVADYLYQKIQAQNYTCPYIGETLVLGVNAHIDHIYPKARFPALATNLNNLEWVGKDANYAKRDLTREEFTIFAGK